MFRNRIIPVLLLMDNYLVKTRKFKQPVYLGDPINICKLFSEKEADELVLLDITATKEKRGPNFELIKQISDEAFVPFAYGGGVRSVDDAIRVVQSGAEKVIINSMYHQAPINLCYIASEIGSQSVVVSLDVGKNWWNSWELVVRGNRTKYTLLELCKRAAGNGAGEILIQDMRRDGMMQGYDLDLVEMVSDSVKIPVTVCGGAGSLQDMKEAVDAGASAAAAGSLFVFQGPHKAVMINYPSKKELVNLFCRGERRQG
jgi:cyclase